MQFVSNEEEAVFETIEKAYIAFEEEGDNRDKCAFEPQYVLASLKDSFDKYLNSHKEMSKAEWNCIEYPEDVEIRTYDFKETITVSYRLGKQDKELDFEIRGEDLYWGYCECKPNDEGYNEHHACCGMDCDWTQPVVDIFDKIPVLSTKWNGTAADFWKIEDPIEDDYNQKKEAYHKEKEAEKQERIRELESALESMKKELGVLKGQA